MNTETRSDRIDDWTRDPATGCSNSSVAYHEIVLAVERLIRGSAQDLISGRSERVASLIVANLAHKHGMAPNAENES